MTLQDQLIRDEGMRLRVYDDATGEPIVPGSHVTGHPTIGVGRALDVHGVSEGEALYLLTDDISTVRTALAVALPWTDNLDSVRFAALQNMAFNLGIGGLLEFKETLAALEAGRYAEAARLMLESRWATQVGPRAQRLAKQIETGVMQ